ncbi:hypothetical protein AJ80_04450 [Polytolypa hystricis UAMH7299]|uniref:C2H2-type domain-containing protein n=1 Tax=Polytolypa hystricis (strain UAMH7299) TaxID=1447883 RepID=A0A2B7YBB6_POLH7|nr:hypothetical protein AJ80_04450 [Polytolypa hystricis UAMH7299]
MAQHYSAGSPCEPNMSNNVGSAHGSQNSFHGNTPWDSREDLRGIMGLHQPVPINTLLENLRPGTDLSFIQPSPVFSNLVDSSSLDLRPSASPQWQRYNTQFSPINARNFHPGQIDRLPLGNQDAWTPLHVTGLPPNATYSSPHVKRQRIYGPDGNSSHSFQEMRSEVGSQINGHLPSDSGYGTNPGYAPRSITTMSDFGSFSVDRRVPRASHHQQASRIPPAPGYSQSVYQYPHSGSQLGHNWSNEKESQTPTAEPVFTCDVAKCTWKGRCPSDKKKHMQRHEKKFLCLVPGCTRKTGFGTINDLERHKKCIHGIEPKHGTSKLYKCFGANCPRKDQDRPRFDNFCQHLRRVHGDEDFDKLIQLSNRWYESEKFSAANRLKEDQLQASLSRRRTGPASTQQSADSATTTSEYLVDNDQISQMNEAINPASIYQGPLPSVSGTTAVDLRSIGGSIQSSHDKAPGSSVIDVPISVTMSNSGESRQPETTNQVGWEAVSEMNCDLEPEPEPENGAPVFDGGRPSSPFIRGIPSDRSDSAADGLVAEAATGLLKVLAKELDNVHLRQRTQDPASSRLFNLPRTQGGENGPYTPSYLDLLIGNGGGRREHKKELIQRLLLAGLEQLGVRDTPPSETPSKDGPPDTTTLRDQSGIFLCPHEGCTRKTKRQCELTKHLKRHDRPYGCTVTNCDKRFGSKNDWKRHENSQHFQLQSWCCEEPEVDLSGNPSLQHPDRPCARLFYRRELFGTHLRRDHGITNGSKIKQALRKNRIGRNGQFQFWCGFCRKLISLTKQGIDAWDERFDHIDEEHFKKGQRIDDWMPPVGEGAADVSPEDKGGQDDPTTSSTSARREDDEETVITAVSSVESQWETRERYKANNGTPPSHNSQRPDNPSRSLQNKRRESTQWTQSGYRNRASNKHNEPITPRSTYNPNSDVESASSRTPSKRKLASTPPRISGPGAQMQSTTPILWQNPYSDWGSQAWQNQPQIPQATGSSNSTGSTRGMGSGVSGNHINRPASQKQNREVGGLISIKSNPLLDVTFVTCCQCPQHTYFLKLEDRCTICQHEPCNDCTLV